MAFLFIPLNNSAGFSLLLIGASGLVVLACQALPGEWALGLSLIFVSYIFYQWWVHIARKAGRSVASVSMNSENRWSVRLASGETASELQLLTDSFCHPLLVLFTLRSSYGTRIRVVVPRGSAAPESFRRLRVLLKEAALDSV